MNVCKMKYPHDEPASKMSYPSLVSSNDHILLQNVCRYLHRDPDTLINCSKLSISLHLNSIL